MWSLPTGDLKTIDLALKYIDYGKEIHDDWNNENSRFPGAVFNQNTIKQTAQLSLLILENVPAIHPCNEKGFAGESDFACELSRLVSGSLHMTIFEDESNDRY